MASQKDPEQPFRTLQNPERFRLAAYPVNPHAAASTLLTRLLDELEAAGDLTSAVGPRQ